MDASALPGRGCLSIDKPRPEAVWCKLSVLSSLKLFLEVFETFARFFVEDEAGGNAHGEGRQA